MSFIPEKAMPHAHAEPGETADESGKIAAIDEGAAEAGEGQSRLTWALGAAGAGIAVAAAAAALFSLRSSSGRRPAQRRTRAKAADAATPKRTAKKPARRRVAKKASAAAA